MRLDRTVRFLQDVQNSDGGFGGIRGGQSDPDFSAWVALALAAAGINPQDQAQPAGIDVYAYLARHASELSFTTDFERVLLVVDASGTSPQDFGGIDLARIILERQLSDGSFPHIAAGRPTVNDTVFAILALSPLQDGVIARALQRAATWLEGEQLSDGSWPSNCPRTLANCSPQAEADMTGAAVEALNAAGRHDTQAQAEAFGFLRGIQNSDGGFPEKPLESESNVASTAWGVQGIWSGGQDPETWIKEAANPLAYMASLQQPDGSIRFKVSEDSIPVWMTAYVAPAFAGKALPVAAVPRAVKSAPTPPPTGAGLGGESSHPGSGVIAGGGGRGAPLFSRPQPQSRGRTRGGARVVGKAHDPAPAARRSHAGARRQPASTAAESEQQADPRSRPEGSARQRAISSRAERQGDLGGRSGGREVKGVLVSALPGARGQATTNGAPGLHSASAGDSRTAWLSGVIGAVIVLFAIAGSQLERKRPQAIL